MADRQIPLPTPHKIDFEAYLQRAEQQRALAVEMIERVHQMCERASEMRKACV